MKNKKLFKISVVLLAIGFVCLVVPAVLMMTGFNKEPEGEHIVLSILLGLGTGLLIAASIYSFCWKPRIKKVVEFKK